MITKFSLISCALVFTLGAHADGTDAKTQPLPPSTATVDITTLKTTDFPQKIVLKPKSFKEKMKVAKTKTRKYFAPQNLPSYNLRGQPLPVDVSYKSQLDVFTPNDKALNDLHITSDDMVKSLHAIPVLDAYYETRLFSYAESPYIPSSLYQRLTDGSCDLDGVKSPCTVIERDSATGKTLTRAYYVGTVLVKKPYQIRVARKEIDQKKFANQISTLLGDKQGDGIFVFSGAPSGAKANEVQQNLVPAAKVEASLPLPAIPLPSQGYLVARANNIRVTGVTDNSSSLAYWQRVGDYIKASTVTLNPPLGPAPYLRASLTYTMKQVRRFAILDSVALFSWGKEPSRISSDGTLTCYSRDGLTAEVIKVKLTEYAKVRVGMVLSTTSNQVGGTPIALGFANSCIDILTAHDFKSVASAYALGIGSNPVIVSKGPQKVIGTSIPLEVPTSFKALTNNTLSIGTDITIEADLNKARN